MRILKIIFILLILITVGEIAYYIYFRSADFFPQNKPEPTKTQQQLEQSRPTVLAKMPVSPTLPFTPPEQAIYQKYINELAKFKSDILVKAYHTFTFKGRVIEWNNKPDIGGVGAFIYKISFRIRADKGTERGFMYNDRDLKIAKFIKTVSGNEQPMDMNEISTGDIIEVTEKKDLFAPVCSADECLVEISVNKIVN